MNIKRKDAASFQLIYELRLVFQKFESLFVETLVANLS